MQSFKTMFDPARAQGAEMRLGFVLGEDRMVVSVASGVIDAVRGEVEGCDVVVRAPAQVVAAAVYGKVPLTALEGEGAMTIEGDRATFARFVDFFHLPEKAG
jgi:alkyl sulfatase BDS1-like metallo-beta-lactamase superfamily hydrolase